MPNLSDLSMEEWREVWKQKAKEWVKTPAFEMITKTGLVYNTKVPRHLQWAFAKDDFDGSIEGLILVATGGIRVAEIGSKTQLAIACALIRWYRQKAEGDK